MNDYSDDVLQVLARQSSARQRKVVDGLARQGWRLLRTEKSVEGGTVVFLKAADGRYMATVNAAGRLELRAVASDASAPAGKTDGEAGTATGPKERNPHERRRGQPPVPPNLGDMLTELQQLALARMGSFGWKILFVRRPAGEPPTVVVGDAAGQQVGILREDGHIDRTTRLEIR